MGVESKLGNLFERGFEIVNTSQGFVERAELALVSASSTASECKVSLETKSGEISRDRAELVELINQFRQVYENISENNNDLGDKDENIQDLKFKLQDHDFYINTLSQQLANVNGIRDEQVDNLSSLKDARLGTERQKLDSWHEDERAQYASYVDGLCKVLVEDIAKSTKDKEQITEFFNEQETEINDLKDTYKTKVEKLVSLEEDIAQKVITIHGLQSSSKREFSSSAAKIRTEMNTALGYMPDGNIASAGDSSSGEAAYYPNLSLLEVSDLPSAEDFLRKGELIKQTSSRLQAAYNQALAGVDNANKKREQFNQAKSELTALTVKYNALCKEIATDVESIREKEGFAADTASRIASLNHRIEVRKNTIASLEVLKEKQLEITNQLKETYWNSKSEEGIIRPYVSREITMKDIVDQTVAPTIEASIVEGRTTLESNQNNLEAINKARETIKGANESLYNKAQTLESEIAQKRLQIDAKVREFYSSFVTLASAAQSDVNNVLESALTWDSKALEEKKQAELETALYELIASSIPNNLKLVEGKNGVNKFVLEYQRVINSDADGELHTEIIEDRVELLEVYSFFKSIGNASGELETALRESDYDSSNGVNVAELRKAEDKKVRSAAGNLYDIIGDFKKGYNPKLSLSVQLYVSSKSEEDTLDACNRFASANEEDGSRRLCAEPIVKRKLTPFMETILEKEPYKRLFSDSHFPAADNVNEGNHESLIRSDINLSNIREEASRVVSALRKNPEAYLKAMDRSYNAISSLTGVK
ncbi:MAG: hypothetical protein ABH824_04595 [Nanoarchaeota archaeon]|nr:hypothetical protein [Nanoarchaeota archaeon]MBU1631836.1 hypothetical protein [Nanoarchaeota archaeon]MBU1876109.1 hypothetical protein [Nanoarchaeota archaeon]